MGVIKDLTGMRFGKLQVIKQVKVYHNPYSSYRGTYWLCHCDCGTDKVVKRECLIRGFTKSCGCGKGRKKVNADG